MRIKTIRLFVMGSAMTLFMTLALSPKMGYGESVDSSTGTVAVSTDTAKPKETAEPKEKKHSSSSSKPKEEKKDKEQEKKLKDLQDDLDELKNKKSGCCGF